MIYKSIRKLSFISQFNIKLLFLSYYSIYIWQMAGVCGVCMGWGVHGWAYCILCNHPNGFRNNAARIEKHYCRVKE